MSRTDLANWSRQAAPQSHLEHPNHIPGSFPAPSKTDLEWTDYQFRFGRIHNEELAKLPACPMGSDPAAARPERSLALKMTPANWQRIMPKAILYIFIASSPILTFASQG
jgi:hypothetical protein